MSKVKFGFKIDVFVIVSLRKHLEILIITDFVSFAFVKLLILLLFRFTIYYTIQTSISSINVI